MLGCIFGHSSDGGNGAKFFKGRRCKRPADGTYFINRLINQHFSLVNQRFNFFVFGARSKFQPQPDCAQSLAYAIVHFARKPLSFHFLPINHRT